MFLRTLSRATAAAVVLLCLTVFSVPAVQARPLDARGPIVDLEGSWFHAVLSWLTGVLAPGGHGGMQPATAADGVSVQPPGMTTNTGSCIDPQGTGGGGGGGHCAG